MPLVEQQVTSLPDLLDRALALKDRNNWIFRGVSEYPAFTLRPSVGRPNKAHGATSVAFEKTMLRRFRQQVRAPAGVTLDGELDWLVLAQHHGLKTRLLDWTRNPLIACSFALGSMGHRTMVPAKTIERWYHAVFGEIPARKPKLAGILNEMPSTGAVYAVPAPAEASESQVRNPFTGKSVRLVNPPHVSDRVARQMSLFTLHPKPNEDWTPKEGLIFVINNNLKRTFLHDLAWLGIDATMMMPSIDAIAGRLSWQHKWGYDP